MTIPLHPSDELKHRGAVVTNGKGRATGGLQFTSSPCLTLEPIARQHYGHNEVRDKWLSENRHKYTLKQLVRKLEDMADEKEWTPLTTTRAIQIAVKRWKAHEQTNSP